MLRRMDKSNPENIPLSFYKICLDESASNLRLPSDFVKKLHLEGKFPQNPLLKIQTGQKWRVEIERSGERACFGKGWLDFVKDTRIQDGDFLVFSLIGNSHFQVYIFDPSGCQKDLSSATPTICKSSCDRSRITDADVKDVIMIEEDEDGNINVEEHDDDDDDDDDEHEVDAEKDIELRPFDWKEKSIGPCFQRVLARFNARYVELPQRFVRESGLRNEGKTILRNKTGEEWPVTVIRWNCYRVYISRGWINFCRVNKLMEGDTCSFQYFHGDQASQRGFIQVEVVKKAVMKCGRPQRIQVARKRGRPSRICPGSCSRSRSRISDADLKNTIKIDEEDDDGDTNVEERDDHDHEVDGEKDIELQPFEGTEKSIKSCFQKVLTPSNAYSVELPNQFLLESGLRNAGKTILRNKSGREWPVKIKTCSGRYRVYITHDWANFRRVNKLMDGDTCSFRYFHGDQSTQSGFILVEGVKKAARKSGRPPRIQAARTRGRPPKIRLGRR